MKYKIDTEKFEAYNLNSAFRKLMLFLNTLEDLRLTDSERNALLQHIVKANGPLYRRFVEVENLIGNKLPEE